MQNDVSLREQFASRAGFILMTVGCAIGLGNVWRFSYVTGEYGGGFFVLLYLIFLAVLGFPVMLMELAVGRAGRSTFPGAFRNLQNPECKYKWHKLVYWLLGGNFILMMFYTVITGWLLVYSWGFISGRFNDLVPGQTKEMFSALTGDYRLQIIGTAVSLFITVLVCLGGVRKVIEKSIKIMMAGLFVLLLVLVVRSLQLPNAMEGVSFFLKPNADKIADNCWEVIHAAMAQAFFTLSLGIGSIAVCGSYTPRENSLAREGVWIILLDTVVAVCSGLVIFPSCAAFDIQPDAGPSLIFITLPYVFNNMPGGSVWGCLFFVFISIAALSTLIAVFENLAAFGMDEWKWSRRKSCLIFGMLLLFGTLPCIFGFNLWKNFQPLGQGTNVLDLEDFIISDNLLPLGALYLTLFCTSRCGWGYKNFCNEVNTGVGWKFSEKTMFYSKYVLPVIILFIWVMGIIKKFNLI